MITAASLASTSSRAFPLERRLHDPRSLAHVGVHLVRLRDSLEELERVAVGGAVLQADDGQAANREVRVARGEIVERAAGTS